MHRYILILFLIVSCSLGDDPVDSMPSESHIFFGHKWESVNSSNIHREVTVWHNDVEVIDGVSYSSFTVYKYEIDKESSVNYKIVWTEPLRMVFAWAYDYNVYPRQEFRIKNISSDELKIALESCFKTIDILTQEEIIDCNEDSIAEFVKVY